MNLLCRQLNPGPCRTYLLTNDISQEAVLIDPVLDRIDEYKETIDMEQLDLSLVIDTHTHADHISGSGALKDIFSCDYAMHASSSVKCAALHLDDGSTFELFNSIPVTVLHTPGHTRDSLCLRFPDRIFTGDTLFLDDAGAGRDDLPGGDAAAHWQSLRKIRELPDELVVYPAHDYHNRKPSALGRQKAKNPHLQKALEPMESFVQYLEDLKLGPADWMKEVLRANYVCAQNPGAAWIPADLPACEVKGTLPGNVNEISVSTISPRKLQEKIRNNEQLYLLDVREKDELDGPLGHLENSHHLPLGTLASRIQEFESLKGRAIITVCRSGGRAATAAQLLTGSGFGPVFVLEGGMIAWNAMK